MQRTMHCSPHGSRTLQMIVIATHPPLSNDEAQARDEYSLATLDHVFAALDSNVHL
jgi:hypothetical protein